MVPSLNPIQHFSWPSVGASPHRREQKTFCPVNDITTSELLLLCFKRKYLHHVISSADREFEKENLNLQRRKRKPGINIHTLQKHLSMKNQPNDIQSLNTPLNGGIACGLLLGVVGGPIGALFGVILGATAGFYYDKKENSRKNDAVS
ncbi:hypothetical protein [Dyadobacter alkalitolerans]|uniref:hypothetical protein n=2 Tax=Dyadobacter TaxID=120831 RepID=UPI0012F88847|nr:hypothetical protein [Dyadobacter alkalitolerans]